MVDAVLPRRSPPRPLAAFADPRTWRDLAYALVCLPLGAVAFTVIVAAQTVGWSLALVLAGLPVLVLSMYAGEWFARVHRGLAAWVTGEPIPVPPRQDPRVPGLLREGWARLTDPVGWREQVHAIVSLGTALVCVAVTATVWGTAGFLVSVPAWGWTGAEVVDDGNTVDTWWEYAGMTAAGAALLVAAPWLTRAAVLVPVVVTRSLLGATRGELEAEGRRLAETRARSVEAADMERRRIERDLHDGAQAQLVALAIDLGRARARLERDGDPETAAIVADAHEQAKRVLVNVRDLARGIHPAILRDRGIDAALSALAAGCAVPVDVEVRLGDARPPEVVERIAYFVVAEGLTNVTRHAGATRASVAVWREDDRVHVTVTDDGRGGAAPGAGSGLVGLADRVAAVDGVFGVDSPPGGGTVLRVELPCG